MDQNTILAPPFAFVIVLGASVAFSFALSRLSFSRKRRGGGATEPYACGEDIPNHMIQPNYGVFLPFALYFLILHVVALTICTVPLQTASTLFFAVLYVVGALVGLSVLNRS
jgi:NADH-quinone oxidoreductase subunit A